MFLFGFVIATSGTREEGKISRDFNGSEDCQSLTTPNHMNILKGCFAFAFVWSFGGCLYDRLVGCAVFSLGEIFKIDRHRSFVYKKIIVVAVWKDLTPLHVKY